MDSDEVDKVIQRCTIEPGDLELGDVIGSGSFEVERAGTLQERGSKLEAGGGCDSGMHSDEVDKVIQRWTIEPGDLELGDVIGSGSFGVVRAGTLQERGSKLEVAVKQIFISNNALEKEWNELFQEAVVLAKASERCRNTCRLYGICCMQEYFCLVMKRYVTSLDKKLDEYPERRAPEGQMQQWMLDICRAVVELHNHNIVVHDLKPANILLDEFGSACLSDFGLSRIVANTIAKSKTTSRGGTFSYMAPEMFNGGSITKKSDVWALGCILLELRTGNVPWEGDADHRIMYKVCMEKKTPTIPNTLHRGFIDMLNMCFIFDFVQRASAMDIYKLIEANATIAPHSLNEPKVVELGDAKTSLNEPKVVESSDPEIWKEAFSIKLSMKDYKGAVVDLNKADELKPNDEYTLKWRGNVKRLMGDYQGALEDMNKANDLKPNDECTLKWRGEVRSLMGNYQGALNDMNKANFLKPNDEWILSIRGDVKKNLNDYHGALVDLNRADELKPNDASTLKWRGEVKNSMGNYQGALEDMNKANDVKPNDKWILKIRGDVKKRLGDYQGALVDLNMADKLKSNDASILKIRGEVKYQLDDYQGALFDFIRANELKPNDAYTLKWCGNVQRLMEDYQGALFNLNRAIELEPNDEWIWSIRGAVKERLSDYYGALGDLNWANKLKPSDAFTLRIRGEVKYKLEYYRGALVDLNKANLLKPNDACIMDMLAATKLAMSENRGILKNIMKALNLKPK